MNQQQKDLSEQSRPATGNCVQQSTWNGFINAVPKPHVDMPDATTTGILAGRTSRAPHDWSAPNHTAGSWSGQFATPSHVPQNTIAMAGPQPLTAHYLAVSNAGTTSTPSTLNRSKPRARFLTDLQEHSYSMPAGTQPLNFTIVEIISLLPVWFKNYQMAARFQNNGITSLAHLAMFQEHRDAPLSEWEAEKAKERITDYYRKAMRTKVAMWKKATHKVPADWEDSNISVSQFAPDIYHTCPHYKPHRSIPFRELSFNIKKLPEGDDAGDLTRALCFALQNMKTTESGAVAEYLFPDDIHTILQQIGYTEITIEHSDRWAIHRYAKLSVDETRRKRNLASTSEEQNVEHPAKRQQLGIPVAALPPIVLPAIPQQPTTFSQENADQFLKDFEAAQASSTGGVPSLNAPWGVGGSGILPAEPQPTYADEDGFPDIPEICQLSPVAEVGNTRVAALVSSGPSADSNQKMTEEDMEALLAPFKEQTFDLDAYFT